MKTEIKKPETAKTKLTKAEETLILESLEKACELVDESIALPKDVSRAHATAKKLLTVLDKARKLGSEVVGVLHFRVTRLLTDATEAGADKKTIDLLKAANAIKKGGFSTTGFTGKPKRFPWAL